MPKINETLVGLFEATSVPVEKQEEFSAIFEAAVAVEAKDVAERVYEAVVADAEAEKAELQEKMNEYSEYLIEEYAGKLDQYLDYTTEKLFEDNKLAITNGVKASLFDSLVEGIKNVVREHGITIADEQVDVVAELEATIAEQQEQLNTAIHECMEMRAEVNEIKKAAALQEACEGLAKTQVEKVTVLAKELSFDESFKRKLQTIVESVSSRSTHEESTPARTQFIKEGNEHRKTSLKNLCNL